ncbi:hypothetical protein HBH56_240570 [Parastagonospora nodorum]|uniref:Chromo domain-containing protein n=1 Tax=Phaeosphaeria nodorum (strain SN15 / ATCC MYA-4574 / FGSC 10173) TaxID=321614 RepID=A0A7U2HWP3_PHANO|nr:hypothetical protein HBH56_240570 [Parastagonospora nodorum]QRC93164.1 hypothetical protein JI435_034080 [Parastagonospora nodorum SN15]KAH3932481.1 hypothetical protein HBH54_083870 [Parastagonospora nodorum]KAH4143848.1 hypothetical protein HBH45_038880 [Parastagonospora nodorum]KAH4146744.1 hypothetical protein HBH44_236140 [Parastagonospora nodorum]
MSVRGPRGGRGRGRGTGRGRGRGGKTTNWEWHNNYSPGPEIYNQLWHIRQEPATVTPFLPTECPLLNARSRILDRRQTEGDIQRNFYLVEVTNFTNRETSVSSAEDAGPNITELLHVDLSRILEYVSPEELERFENEQFQVEAEAEAVAMRMEAEELRRRRLEKNARSAAMGQGSRMLSGLSLDPEMRPRGRPRGRGRGRGRGSWRGRAALVSNTREQDTQDQLVDAEVEELIQTEDGLQMMMINETDSEDGDFAADLEARRSPNMARSAFVANSALPLSPVLSHRRPSGAPSMLRNPTVASDDDEESDLELVDRDARSTSSAAMQLRIEDDIRGRPETAPDDDGDSHRSKRRRTESTTSTQRRPRAQENLPELPNQRSPYSNAIPESPAEDSDDAIPAHEPNALYRSLQNGNSNGTELDNIHVQSPTVRAPVEQQSGDDNDDEEEDAEEYVVEAIIEHYRDAGKKFYLVKWQGYEDSHDWLPEENLEGAAELVAEFNEKVRRRKMKDKQRMTK